MRFYVLKYIAKPKGESGESCKSIYSLDHACKACGTGAKLIGSLLTKGLTKIKSAFFATLDGDLLISEGFYEFLISRGIRINHLRKVLDTKKNPLPFYHLSTEFFFPKSLPSSEGLVIDRQCQVCKRNGYFTDAKIGNYKKGIPTVITPLILKYKGISHEFLNSSDLFNTWEHLGLSNFNAEGMKVIRYARPMLLVSENLKNAFEEYGVKDVLFEEAIIQ